MKNNYPSGGVGLYSDAFEITPDDDNDLTQLPQALWIGGTGDLVVTVPSGDITFTNVPDGTELRIRAIRVLEATTATDIVGLV